MEDTDLSNLTPEEAREYVLAFITSLKQTTAQKRLAESELDLWRGRLKLAEERGAAELRDKAATFIQGLEEKHATLEAEEQELQGKVSRLKEGLRKIEITGKRLVDTDLLLAELQMAVGEEKSAEIETDRAMNEAQAQSALEAMKRKLRGEQK